MATITGTALDDNLVGVTGQPDTLYGLAGNDKLTGDGPVVAPIVRVSTGVGDAQAASDSWGADISADGRYVVFSSYAANLVAGDTNVRPDVFLKDVQTGAITRVSTAANGTQAAGESFGAAVSADGRYVVFASGASNLVAGDTNMKPDIFLKDTLTGAITRVNTTAAGAQATGYSFGADLSADGRYVAFVSDGSDLVAGNTNVFGDIFVKDTRTGAISLVGTRFDLGTVALSADGRYVLFISNADDLVVGDTNRKVDIFLKDTLTGAITRVNTTAAGAQTTGFTLGAALSADGRYVVFDSTADSLVAGDTNGGWDIFLKDTLTGAISRVNTSATGVEASAYSENLNPAISADGRYVVFESDAWNLVAGDTNGHTDVFIKDTWTGALARVNTSASGAQAMPYHSFAPAISADGRYVTFESQANNLVDGDTNGATDIFRVLNPLLDGDTLRGGPGDDRYVIAVPNDRVVEAPNEGKDTVFASIGYALPDNVENLVLTGDAAIRGTGNALDNILRGNIAANILNGGAGADTMAGGAGNDTYVVDDAGDAIRELPGEGSDTILSSVSLVLPDNVENLRLTGAEAINGTGNGLRNLMRGNAGDNVLDGGAGVDTVSYANAMAGVNVRIDLLPIVNATGGAGQDTLSNFENIIGSAFNDTLIGSAKANLIEGGAGGDVLDGGAGSDVVSYATARNAVTVNLGLSTPQDTRGAGIDTLANFEHVVGSRFNDTLIGNAGNNMLRGGAGADTLTGGAGTDYFVFDTNQPLSADTVTDFLTSTDKLRFSQAGLRVGDGDTLVENAVAVAGPGGFSANAELVLVTGIDAGPITNYPTSAVAAAIGSASTPYAVGATALFAVGAGTDAGVFLFTSSGADAVVSAAELTLVVKLLGTSTTTLADYLFAP